MTTTSRPLCTLCFESVSDYRINLDLLVDALSRAPKDALILAHEVCLTGFDYDQFEEAADFGAEALKELCLHVSDQILVFTLIEQRNGLYYNVAKVITHNRVVHEQAKAMLFTLGSEERHFAPGTQSDIAIFEIDGIKLGILICFELRFKTLWKQLEGADIILIPARWGHTRAHHFRILTTALAIMNQCYLLCADGANADATALSGIIDPFGEEQRNEGLLLTAAFEPKKIAAMRRYINVGIANEP
ncbi:MAG: carbon-nitrogen hydrolase family protein [Campylobacterales bacterium]|nr:carbon-nitrogen hydrolase family protein [Campylobacterales bacterium]